MATRVFCTIEDLERYEPNILDLAETGNFNNELEGARKEIEDRLITALIVDNLDKLGDDIQPRQLRTPSIFLTLEMIFTANLNDNESPYQGKRDYYSAKFEASFSSITVLDLDSDEDGTLEEGEQNTRSMNHGRIRRR